MEDDYQERVNNNLHDLIDTLQEQVKGLQQENASLQRKVEILESRVGHHANWLSELASEFHNYKDRNPGRML